MHKSQGQTIDRVKVDLGSVFEKGQGLSALVLVGSVFIPNISIRPAYVALSRATSLETLEVVNFSPSRSVIVVQRCYSILMLGFQSGGPSSSDCMDQDTVRTWAGIHPGGRSRLRFRARESHRGTRLTIVRAPWYVFSRSNPTIWATCTGVLEHIQELFDRSTRGNKYIRPPIPRLEYFMAKLDMSKLNFERAYPLAYPVRHGSWV